MAACSALQAERPVQEDLHVQFGLHCVNPQMRSRWLAGASDEHCALQAQREAAYGLGGHLAPGQGTRHGRNDRPEPHVSGPFCALSFKYELPGEASDC